MAVLSILINGALVGASAYAMHKIQPSSPYLFASTAILGLYGVRGLFAEFGKEETVTKVNGITDAVVEICPYTLRNLQFFEDAGDMNNMVLSHGMLQAPLLAFFIYYYFKGKTDESEKKIYTLAELAFYGHSVSLIQLGLNEDNQLYLMMAAVAFMARYVPALCERHYENIHAFFLSILCFLDSETKKPMFIK